MSHFISFVPENSYQVQITLGPFTVSVRSEIILTVIAAVTAWYAIRAFTASRRNNELSTVPHLTIIRTGSIGSYNLLIRNHNDRMAYKIRVDSVRTLAHETNQFSTTTFKVLPAGSGDGSQVEFPGGANQIHDLPLKILEDAKDIDQDFAIFKTTMLTKYAHGIVFRFSDSQNLAYFTRLDFEFESGNSILLRAPTRLSLFWRLTLWVERNIFELILLSYEWTKRAIQRRIKRLVD